MNEGPTAEEVLAAIEVHATECASTMVKLLEADPQYPDTTAAEAAIRKFLHEIGYGHLNALFEKFPDYPY